MQGMGMMRGNRGQPPDPEAMHEMIEASLVDLEIFLPGDDRPYRMPVKEAQGIEVKLNVSEAGLFYEIKVPLYEGIDHPHAINALPGKAIGVGFETAKFDREEMMGHRGGGGFGGGGGSFGGGRSGGFGGRPGGGFHRPQPEQFKLWVSVQPGSGEGTLSSEQQPR